MKQTVYKADIARKGTGASVMLIVLGFEVRRDLDTRDELSVIRDAVEYLLPPGARVSGTPYRVELPAA